MSERQPHRLNVLGDFYVVDQCCTACGVPDVEAPDLFGWDDEHCYVKQQPVTESDLKRMIATIAAADLGCIRYRGTDPHVLLALADAGEADQADHTG